jgi:spore germination protein KB
MKQNTLVSRQLAFLLFLCMLGTAFIFVPVNAAGRSSWLSSMAGSLIFFFILYLMIAMQKMYPGVSILEISKQSLGTAGTLLNIIYLATAFLMIILYLYDFTQFLLIFFPRLSPLLIEAIIVLMIININYHGLTTLGRLNDVFTFPAFILAFLALLIPMFSINWSNFLPLLTDWKPVFAGTLIAANWPFGEVIFLALLMPYVTDLKQNSRTIYYWYGIAAFLMFLCVIVVIGVIGPETSILLRFPLYHVLRGISLAGFQRIELFFFILWFLIEGAVVDIFFACLTIGIKESLKLKNRSILLFPLGLLIIIMINYMFPSDIEVLKMETITIAFLTLPVYIFYPTIIYFAAWLRARKMPGHTPRPVNLNDS